MFCFSADQNLLIAALSVRVRFGGRFQCSGKRDGFRIAVCAMRFFFVQGTYEPGFVAALAVGVGLQTAIRRFLHCDRRKNQGVGCAEYNNAGQSDDDFLPASASVMRCIHFCCLLQQLSIHNTSFSVIRPVKRGRPEPNTGHSFRQMKPSLILIVIQSGVTAQFGCRKRQRGFLPTRPLPLADIACAPRLQGQTARVLRRSVRQGRGSRRIYVVAVRFLPAPPGKSRFGKVSIIYIMHLLFHTAKKTVSKELPAASESDHGSGRL